MTVHRPCSCGWRRDVTVGWLFGRGSVRGAAAVVAAPGVVWAVNVHGAAAVVDDDDAF